MGVLYMSKISLSIIPRDLPEIAGRPNGLPSFLIDAWSLHHGKYPVKDQERHEKRVAQLTRWRNNHNRIAWICSMTSTVLLGWMVFSSIMTGGWPPNFLQITFAVSTAISVYALFAKAGASAAFRRAAEENSAFEFLKELDTLATVIHNHLEVKLSVQKLSTLTKESLKKFADQVLVMKAVDVLLTQEQERNVPKEMQDNKRAIHHFKLFEEVFRPFGLVDKRPDRYFDTARSEIDAAKLKAKQQPEHA